MGWRGHRLISLPDSGQQFLLPSAAAGSFVRSFGNRPLALCFCVVEGWFSQGENQNGCAFVSAGNAALGCTTW